MSARVSPSDIIAAVCGHYVVDPRELVGGGSAWALSHPRHMAMYVMRKLTGRSLHEVAQRFRRDHTTVLHAQREVKRRMEADPQYVRAFEAVVARTRAIAEERQARERRWVAELVAEQREAA